jgi:pSer/pThr/pTyr-binding forkhead associated (FHA) protein
MTEILIGPPSELAWLVVTSGPRTGKEFRLGEVTGIGRDPTQNEVVIDDQAMSRQHAKIKLEGKKFVIHDLASSNGTFVNDGQVYRQVLSDGDRIRMGETEFTFIEVQEKGEGGKPATGKSKKRQKA